MGSDGNFHHSSTCSQFKDKDIALVGRNNNNIERLARALWIALLAQTTIDVNADKWRNESPMGRKAMCFPMFLDRYL